MISHDPAENEVPDSISDWLEIVVDGLTFDLLGLAPGRTLIAGEPRHCFGAPAANFTECEAIGLAPGPHLAGAANAMPVVRTMLGLAAGLAAHWPDMRGTLWQPANAAIESALFRRLVHDWLGGGPFPALGLSGIVAQSDGTLASDGLSFFTGQELVLDTQLSSDRQAASQLLVRLIDRLVGLAPLEGESTIALGDGASVLLRSRGQTIDVRPG